MHLDLHDRRTLAKSWLATLHGPDITFRPTLVGPLPAWGPLLRTALAWHIAYALTSYAGALVISRVASSNPLARAIASGGTAAVVAVTLVLWMGGVVVSSGLWWVEVRRVRQPLSNQASS
jgi:hypothetical protein